MSDALKSNSSLTTLNLRTNKIGSPVGERQLFANRKHSKESREDIKNKHMPDSHVGQDVDNVRTVLGQYARFLDYNNEEKLMKEPTSYRLLVDFVRLNAFCSFLVHWGFSSKTIQNKVGNLKFCVSSLKNLKEFQTPWYRAAIEQSCRRLERGWRSVMKAQANIARSKHLNEVQLIKQGVFWFFFFKEEESMNVFNL